MRNYLKNFDIWLYILPILLSITGIAVVYSLIYSQDTQSLVIKQVVSLGVGILALVFLTIYDYRQLKNVAWPLYIVSVLLLLIVDLWGHTSGGATRWLQFGPVQIQPSELFKVVAIIFWASYFSAKVGEVKLRDFLALIVFFGLPLFLVLKQPDLGTALVLIFIILITLFWVKLSKKQLLALWTIILLVPFVAYLALNNVSIFGHLLQDYQRARLEVFLDPGKDILGRGYNVKQAIIAVGSGGLTGRGLGQGSQSQLQFLPKAQTDFIFSGFAEAFGFLGSVALIAVFGFLLVRIIRAANLAKDNFGLLLCVGGGAMLFFHVVENIGMNVGLLPVTGVPLPFLSAGGSSLVINFAILGIIESVVLRHKKIIF